MGKCQTGVTICGEQNRKKVIENTMGMFDIIKGIGIILVIIEHTMGLFAIEEWLSGQKKLFVIGNMIRVIRTLLMPVFFIISGYGFRAVGINKKSLRKQINYLLKPYIYVAFFAAILLFVSHYFLFRYWKGAIIESLKVAGGFILGVEQTVSIDDIMVYGIGASWYILALFFSWIILLVICQLFREKAYVGVCISLIVGWLLCMICPNMPFCIVQSLIGVGFLYFGYMAKKEKWFVTNMPWYGRCLLLLPVITVFWGGGNFAYNQWKLGLLDIAGSMVAAYIVIKALLYLNYHTNIITSFLGKIGQLSLWVFCVHSIEMSGGLWYMIVQKYDQDPLLGACVVFGMRCIFIFICVIGIQKVRFRR